MALSDEDRERIKWYSERYILKFKGITYDRKEILIASDSNTCEDNDFISFMKNRKPDDFEDQENGKDLKCLRGILKNRCKVIF